MQCPVYIDVCSDLIPGVACRFCYRPLWSEILCSLSSSIAVAGGRVLVVCHVSRSLLIVVVEGRDFDYLPQLARIDGIKYCCSAFFLVTAIVPSNWDSVSTLLL